MTEVREAEIGMPGEGDGDVEGARWPSAVLLFLVTLFLSVTSTGPLLATPYLLLLLLLPSGSAKAWIMGALALVVVSAGAGVPDGFWYLERGWALLVAGSFVAFTLRFPRSDFFARGLGAVGVAVALVGALFLVRPGSWSIVEWMVATRVTGAVASGVEGLRILGGSDVFSPEMRNSIYAMAETQIQVFPALVALSSLSALALAWWVFRRFAAGETGLGALGRFRFSDSLVWILIAGLAALLAGGGAVERAGANAVAFMAGLYVVRGAAVVWFVNGGVSLAGGILLALAFLLVAPMLLGGAFIVGLGDTWLDLRRRVEAARNSES